MRYLSERVSVDPFASPDSVVRDIKKFIADQLSAIDTTVEVRSTEYFDHAFAPDLVLRWASAREPRYVFLRAGAAASILAEDRRLFEDSKPLVLSIASTEEDPEQTFDEDLVTEARELDTFLMGIDATVDLGEQSAVETSVRLLGQGLLQGGRGAADQDFVRETAAAVIDGFAAAEAGRVEPTSHLLNVISKSLQPQESTRLSRVVRAIWTGHGQRDSDFPGSDSLGPLGDEDLRYLLTSLEGADEEFWDRVAHSVDLEQIVRIANGQKIDIASLESFQSLVHSRVHTLRSKAVRAEAHQSSLLTDDSSPSWRVRNGVLALASARSVFYIAARRSGELATPKPDPKGPRTKSSNLPTFETVVNRRDRAQIALTMIEVDQGSNQKIIFDSREASGKAFEDVTVQAVITKSSRIKKVATICDGSEVEADFSTRTIATRTSGRTSLVPLVRIAADLLVDLPDNERHRVEAFLATPTTSGSELPLEEADQDDGHPDTEHPKDASRHLDSSD